MKLINTTHYDSGLIEYILTEAGADTSKDFTLKVEYLEGAFLNALLDQYGEVKGAMFFVDGIHTVRILKGASLDTLAHELKHVEQALYLGDDFNSLTEEEAAYEEYQSRWYEVEAREFQARWKR